MGLHKFAGFGICVPTVGVEQDCCWYVAADDRQRRTNTITTPATTNENDNNTGNDICTAGCVVELAHHHSPGARDVQPCNFHPRAVVDDHVEHGRVQEYQVTVQRKISAIVDR